MRQSKPLVLNYVILSISSVQLVSAWSEAAAAVQVLQRAARGLLARRVLRGRRLAAVVDMAGIGGIAIYADRSGNEQHCDCS